MKTYEKYLFEATIKINGLRAKPIKKKYQGRKLARGMDMRNFGEYYAETENGGWEEIPKSLVESGFFREQGKTKASQKYPKSDKEWKEFYMMAKDTSGNSLAEFEKKYAQVTDMPHIADALNKTKNFGEFKRMIKVFER